MIINTIQVLEARDKVPLGLLNAGELFKTENLGPLIKTNSEPYKPNAICVRLDTGEVHYVGNRVEVTPLQARFEIFEQKFLNK